MDIILVSGQLNGERHHNVPDHCVIFRRSAVSPLARYRNTGNTAPDGYRVFEYSPLRSGEPETTEGVHDV